VHDKITKTVATDLPQNAARHPKSGKVDTYVGRAPTRMQLQLVNGHKQSASGQSVHWSRDDICTHNTQDHDLATAHDALLMGRKAGRDGLPAHSITAFSVC
jgi:hypothetical protein